MLTPNELTALGRQLSASDIHLHAGMPPIIRVNGTLLPMPDQPAATEEEITTCVRQMLGESRDLTGDLDFCYEAPDTTRHRVNTYRQSGKLGAAIRLLSDVIPSIDSLALPQALHTLTASPRGLVLVTGPTGSGKSTTLAAMIDEINEKRRCHILTLEDPVEYKYKMKNSLINQREVGRDVGSFSDGLKSALREDPDVILVGEMRDFETIGAAITAAETGHLVFSTLHTTGAASTVDRIIDVFPAGQQQQIRTQLAAVLKGVLTQQLLPRADKPGRIAATELLITTDAVANLIRENKTHQMATSMQTGSALGMHTLSASLARLVSEGIISTETALGSAGDKEELRRALGR